MESPAELLTAEHTLTRTCWA